MIRAEHWFVLPGSPAEAFAVLSDPARDPDWVTACLRTTLLDGPPAPGRRYEITFDFLGRIMDFLVEINVFEPAQHSRFTTLAGPFHYIGNYRYNLQPDGSTEVHWTFDVEPGEFFGLMPDSLIRKFLVSQVEKDAAALRERLTVRAAAAMPGTADEPGGSAPGEEAERR
jgi:hypothetical protein